MRFTILLLLFSAACIVPPQQGGGSDEALLSQVEKDLSKYLTDHENGVAFVRCIGNSSAIYAGPSEAARSIAAGCDAALAVSIPRLGKVQDIDPVTVDGTTIGFVVRYATALDEPPPPVEPDPPDPTFDPPTTQPMKIRSTPPPEAAPAETESVTPKPEDNEPVTPKP